MDPNKQIASNSNCVNTAMVNTMPHVDLPIPWSCRLVLAAFAARALHYTPRVCPQNGDPHSLTWCNLDHHGLSQSGSYWSYWFLPSSWRWTVHGPNFEGPEDPVGSSAGPAEPLRFCLRKDWRNSSLFSGTVGLAGGHQMVWYISTYAQSALAYYSVGSTMVGDVSNFYEVGHCFLTCYLIQLIHVLITPGAWKAPGLKNIGE